MRLSAVARRTKKFFSKKRREAKFELASIAADGFSRGWVESDAREFQSRAINHESKAALFRRIEANSKKILHDNRLGRSDGFRYSDSVPRAVKPLMDDIEMSRIEANQHSQAAAIERKRAVMRRLYSQKMLKEKSRK